MYRTPNPRVLFQHGVDLAFPLSTFITESHLRAFNLCIGKINVFYMATTIHQLLRRVQTTEDRIAVAEALVELAERAEHDMMLQHVLRRMIPPPPFDVFEYIKPGNRKGYWARKPYWREHPTPNQLEARMKFSKINYLLYGIKGTVERQDGTRISKISQVAGDLMKGKFVSAKELAERRRQRVIKSIARTA